METSVILLLYKITEHLTLCKNCLSKWSSSKLSRKLSKRALIQSESSMPQKCWLASEVRISTQKYWRCSWKKFRTPKNDAAMKWRESVSVQLYCQKLTGFIRWSGCNVVHQCILQRCCRRNQHHFFRCGLTFGSLTEAYTSFREIRCHSFDLFCSWHHPGGKRATGRSVGKYAFSRNSRYCRVLCLQFWLFRKSLQNNTRISFERNSCETLPLFSDFQRHSPPFLGDKFSFFLEHFPALHSVYVLQEQ